MVPRPAPPAERVRERLLRSLGPTVADALPRGYQRLGRVLVLRLPPALLAHGLEIAEAWRVELGVEAVLTHAGPVDGELREPGLVRLGDGPTETEVIEYGSRWRLDASRILFSRGNRTERQRFSHLVEPHERVADLFAGIGYFTVPAARAQPTARFVAVEKNPLAFRYLEENLRLNAVADRVRTVLGDNRTVVLPAASFDRVLLGYLPSSLPWVPRALALLVRPGGWLHVHLVVDAHAALPIAAREVERAVEQGGARLVGSPQAREVKPYGPGRSHAVVDVPVRVA